MWQCENCGYTDDDGSTFEVEVDDESSETVRYCPECGSDEVFLMDELDDDSDSPFDEDEDDDDQEYEDATWGDDEEVSVDSSDEEDEW
jgi:hypothetical protein